ncbi:SDR family oxidoreductase [Xylanibacter ruminicola]|uniref:Nucleoside-diphosphate-sugar epimerase n=1 Tax=Xylanibacter ruminicola TaxID=839 RepID=A0A1M6UEC5_XYLRU|nr:SDR family oxidoreductase [Xylanibacter ruminicola]SHK67530.1 Nucleoside-diphosphate-sugar epimerase [Xylanibacter ruminicola]
MKILIIGGTGTISSAITRQLVAAGHELWLINRGNRTAELPDGIKLITGDINNREDEVVAKLGNEQFDAVCEFIGFLPSQVERDIRLFTGRTKQYVFVSSASAYNKPVRNHVITEGTSLANPYWEYSRNKIACEELLMKAYRENGFPATIVRPSHTYCERAVPVSVHGPKGSWSVLKRMIEGKQVIVHGDGSSLWTLTWNEDFARGFIGLLGNPTAIGEAFQIMSDESLTWNQIYQTVADALGVEFKPYYVSSSYLAQVSPREWDFEGNLLGDKACTVVFDCSKLKRAVPGFCATTRFDQGVRHAVAYIKSHPEFQIEDPEFDIWCDKVIDTIENTRQQF